MSEYILWKKGEALSNLFCFEGMEGQLPALSIVTNAIRMV